MIETTEDLSGTDLYQRTIAAQYPTPEDGILMQKIWSPTPWMVDMVTEGRYEEIYHWCRKFLGQESSPIHAQIGIWHRGNVTLRGRTWFGFRSKELMSRFLAQFPEIPNPHDEIFDWPTNEGIWMGDIEKIGWFPFQIKALRDDLPSAEQMRLERETLETAPPRAILCLVAQWMESDRSWPFLFKGNHPAKQWRQPPEDELSRARKFYGII